MKNHLFILLSFFVISCKTNEPLIDYIKDFENQDSYISINEEKIPSLILTNNIKQRLVSDSMYNVINPLKEHYSNILLQGRDSENWKKWKKTNFCEFKNLSLIEKNNSFVQKNHLIKENKRYFYSFSKPFYSIDKNLVTFCVSRSEGWNTIFFGIITMEKKDKKWNIIDTISNSELN